MSSKKSKINLFGASSQVMGKSLISSSKIFSPPEYPQCAQLAQQGKFSEALSLLQAVLRSQPGHALAWQLHGVLMMRQAQWATGLASLQKAVNLGLNAPPIHNNIGIALRELGQLEESLAAYERALQLQPDYLSGWINKANCLRQARRLREAMNSYQSALELDKESVNALHGLALCLLDLGETEEACLRFEHVLTLTPDWLEARCMLASALEQRQLHGEAIENYLMVLERDPLHAQSLNGLGLVYHASNQHDKALAAYQKAIQAAPEQPEAYANLASLLVERQQYEQAEKLYSQALSVGADPLAIQQHLAEMHVAMKFFDAASANYAAICSADAAFEYAQSGCLSTSMRAFNWERAGAAKKVLAPGVLDGNQGLLPFDAISFFDDPTLHLKAAQAHVESFQKTRGAIFSKGASCVEKARVRVAYVSADFHDHATMHLMKETFENQDRNAFEWTAVHLGAQSSEAQEQWLAENFDHIVDGRAMSNAELVEQLRAMALDVAVDLKGHTRESRFEIFEARVAPLQVSYLGYPGTTGSCQMDFVLGDAVVTPWEHQVFYTERIWQLPGSYQVNKALCTDAAQVRVSREIEGLPESAFVFACFNNGFKITPAVFDVWLRLLQQVRGSVLWLLRAEDVAQERLRAYAAARGIGGERLVFARRAAHDEHLARHQLADLFLDTSPYGAHTTASDVLRSGGVMVTCPGKSFASRVGASLLTSIGCESLVTSSWDAYEALALSLATDPNLLQEHRRQVSAGLEKSDLFDPVAGARKLEAAYRDMLSARPEIA